MLEVPSAPTFLLPSPLPKHAQFKIKKCQAQMPPAKYLIRRRHSLAPEAIIWEGNDELLEECPKVVAAAQPRHSCRQFISSSSASTGAVPSSAQNAGVAIDSKIEQAMDLVKSHLIYAVRDEIELLRTRIADLETTVLHLEAENAILRDAIPRQVLASICLDPVAKPKPVLAFSSSAAAAIAQ